MTFTSKVLQYLITSSPSLACPALVRKPLCVLSTTVNELLPQYQPSSATQNAANRLVPTPTSATSCCNFAMQRRRSRSEGRSHQSGSPCPWALRAKRGWCWADPGSRRKHRVADEHWLCSQLHRTVVSTKAINNQNISQLSSPKERWNEYKLSWN